MKSISYGFFVIFLAALMSVSAGLMAQDPPPRPYVAWPDHNYSEINPPSFEPDDICGPGQTPLADFCWEIVRTGTLPVFDPQGDASPAGTDIASGTIDGTFPSVYYSFADLSNYPAAIQDKLPGGVIFLRMRLRESPLSNNVKLLEPYAASAAWHFLIDINGNGYSDFVARTYGVPNEIQIFFNDYSALHLSGDTTELNTSCGPAGVRLWTEPTALVNFTYDTGLVDVPIPLGCSKGGGNNRDKYCNFGYTRVINKDVENVAEMAFLDMQFPLYAFRSCRTGDEFVPIGEGQAVRGAQAFEAGQPFVVCASTGTQSNNIFAKDFAITSPAGFTPALEDSLACSNPCTLAGGCETGLLLIEASSECGSGAQSSPIELNAVVMATNELIEGAVVSSVNEITFQYWQNGVSNEWQTIQTLNSPTTGLNEYQVFWDTSMLDISQSAEFQIRVIGSDKFDKTLAETFIQLDITECTTTGTPVSLAFFSAEQQGPELRLEWSTSSETANVGFNIYGETSSGRLVPLNDDLIESPVVDSVLPQDYQFSVARSDIRKLYLEDVDVRGISRTHGPFETGRDQGRKPEIQAIDWAGVGSENRAHQQQRGQSWRAQGLDPVRLLVEHDGVYRVTWSDLDFEGLDLRGIPVSRISLTHQGESVPFHTEARGLFGPGDFIEFYGTGLNSLYTDQNVYLLRFDGPQPRLMGNASNAGGRDAKGPTGRPGTGQPEPLPAQTRYMETVSVWRERLYSFSSLGGSPWYDTRIMARNSAQTRHFDFELEGLVPSQPASAHVQYWGMTSWADVPMDQHVVVSLNGVELGDDRFDGRVLRSTQYDLAPGLLVEGLNRLSVRLPGNTGAPWSIIGFDGFRVSYPRELVVRDGILHFEGDAAEFRVGGLSSPQPLVYRIDDDGVTRITGYTIDGDGPFTVHFQSNEGAARYFVSDPDQLLTPGVEPGRAERDIRSGRADYLMIAHPNFIDGLGPLVSYHESMSRTVRVVDLFDIYDQFSGGVVDPKAIQAYIRATAESMGYQHVLLVGGDTYDYKNIEGTNSISFVPSLYAATGEFVEFAPADALFVDLNRNRVPDLPIGRLPVRTNAELNEVINKTLEYVNRDYRRSAVFAADQADPSISYTQVSNNFVNQIAGTWEIDRAYTDWMAVPEAKEVLRSSISEGRSLTNFVGHSSFSIWTFKGLFNASDIAEVGNYGRPTAVVQYGCWNTYHVIPSYNTMGHSFMLTEGQGAAVVVGSSTWTAASSAELMGRKFMPHLVSSDLTVGQALTRAKHELAETHPHLRDAILGWTILGDPAIMIGD